MDALAVACCPWSISAAVRNDVPAVAGAELSPDALGDGEESATAA